MISYDPHDWRSHLCDIRGSMLREIVGRVAMCVLVAVVVCALEDPVKQWWGIKLSFSEIAHALIGTALGLLLVFRTNASYDRFWEGRKQWGSIVNICRNLTRGASIYLAADPAGARRVIDWTMLFPWAVMCRLREQVDLTRLPDHLPKDELAPLLAAGHVPLAVACKMTDVLAEAARKQGVSDYVRMQLDLNIQALVDCLGACERIHNTPLPFAYVVHLRRALLIYCYTLPFALWDRFGWGTVAVTLVLTYALFGIEEIGVEIEDPFGVDENDLPLETICAGIERNLAEVRDRL